MTKPHDLDELAARLNARIYNQREQLGHSQFVTKQLRARVTELEALLQRAANLFELKGRDSNLLIEIHAALTRSLGGG